MRIAAIYDIHGNLPALEAVLQEIEDEAPDLIAVGGDVASGPMPGEIIERLRQLPAPARFIRGNGDRALVTCFDGLQAGSTRPDSTEDTFTWVARQIGKEQRDFLDSNVLHPPTTAEALAFFEI